VEKSSNEPNKNGLNNTGTTTRDCPNKAADLNANDVEAAMKMWKAPPGMGVAIADKISGEKGVIHQEKRWQKKISTDYKNCKKKE